MLKATKIDDAFSQSDRARQMFDHWVMDEKHVIRFNYVEGGFEARLNKGIVRLDMRELDDAMAW
jgi:hypothetical protein